MYAEHKGYHLDRVEVRLRHDKIYAKDCADCETKEGKIDRIQKHLHIEGDLTIEQKKRMIDIANKCPVHRTLRSEIRVEIDLVDDR